MEYWPGTSGPCIVMVYNPAGKLGPNDIMKSRDPFTNVVPVSLKTDPAGVPTPTQEIYGPGALTVIVSVVPWSFCSTSGLFNKLGIPLAVAFTVELAVVGEACGVGVEGVA